ncbi:predicted protein [Sclerotinia sclerotiorum 1980 UF-70]|uniref:Uncharacterized protein n=1 Tax=Sclerotinia sclerotiorum (strain ATCC 18683 / 1980 / Ss-1) TaxID=665079 RepID=A7F808_SCLS1|nr:predicted protein [Sclerotinia sclerotiorum 1980 UF-70]EDN98879.1 predicted protein [Sclerotinia sclerotiorum 1980 UF-70]
MKNVSWKIICIRDMIDRSKVVITLRWKKSKG